MKEAASSLAMPPEEDPDVDLDQVPFEEPAARKRRVSQSFDWLVANEAPPLRREE